ncbi:4Fe-4S binding protein [Geobacter sp. DSM 9736]|uniref:4Fe-4S binding protein n=1 Tax=Geobacter sp. DSM 9736 TaxID=1277350 RepID=UPI001E4A0F90|nr:4Fe-4S binding protein [Geobacter sp. DSM 9736]
MRHPVPSEELPWYPEISWEKCKGCRTCFRFCPAAALVFNRTRRKVRLKYPTRCRVECRICARFCPARAISFPDQTRFVSRHLAMHEPAPLPSAHPAPPPVRPRLRPLGTPSRFIPLGG